MRRAGLIGVAGVLLGSVLAHTRAEERSSTRRPARQRAHAAMEDSASSQDFLFFGPIRPALYRLRATIDDKPFRKAWDDYLGSIFDNLDRDGNGSLSAAEAESAPYLAGVGFTNTDGPVAMQRSLQKLIKELGGSMGRSDLQAFYQRNGVAAFSARPSSAPGGFGRALFDLLDGDDDEFLTADELQRTGESLRKRDFDDDEVLVPAELAGARGGYQPGVVGNATGTSSLPASSAVMILEPSTSPAMIAEKLLQRYDADGDGTLSTSESNAEVDLEPDLVAALDQNRDGQLGPDELARFCDRDPDFDLQFALGKTRSLIGSGRIGSRRIGRKGSRASNRSVRSKARGYEVETADAKLEFTRNNADPVENNRQLFFFDDFDGDKNGYIGPKEAENFSGNSFKAMDADGDEKVVKAEFDAFVELQLTASSMRVVLTVAEHGHELFERLDDGDGRLTRRELRQALDLIATGDLNGDGRLASSEIPHRLQLEISRGGESGTATPRAMRLRNRSGRRVLNEDGPVWFVKMDRNGDGDLSPREFLGSKAVFDKTDGDGDGLIDLDEAKAADQEYRNEN